MDDLIKKRVDKIKEDMKDRICLKLDTDQIKFVDPMKEVLDYLLIRIAKLEIEVENIKKK